MAPGRAVGRFIYDDPGETTETAAAIAGVPYELRLDWPDRPDGARLPATLKAFLKAARVQLVPLHSIDASFSAGDLFATSQVEPDQYVALVRVGGALVTGFGWARWPLAGGPWRSGTSSAFSEDFPAAEAALARHFGTRMARLRIFDGQYGFWVIGRSRDDEVAAFVAPGQGEWPEELVDGRLYTMKDVLRYEAPVSGGNTQ